MFDLKVCQQHFNALVVFRRLVMSGGYNTASHVCDMLLLTASTVFSIQKGNFLVSQVLICGLDRAKPRERRGRRSWMRVLHQSRPKRNMSNSLKASKGNTATMLARLLRRWVRNRNSSFPRSRQERGNSFTRLQPRLTGRNARKSRTAALVPCGDECGLYIPSSMRLHRIGGYLGAPWTISGSRMRTR